MHFIFQHPQSALSYRHLHELLSSEGNVVVFFTYQKVAFLALQLHALGIPLMYGNLFVQP